MITIYPAAHALHAPATEMLNGRVIPAHETPRRAEMIYAAIQASQLGAIIPPQTFGMAPVAAIHAPEFLRFLEHAYERWVAAGGTPEAVVPDTLAVRWMNRHSTSPLAEPGYYAFDLGAAIVEGTWQAARASADAALTGAALLLDGERRAYALCRPPGHHAGTDMYGGYCFLNNAAIAAQYLRDQGAPRVAILDIDYHHGNGTQQIFYRREDVLTISIHADPNRDYPYYAGYADERGAEVGLGYNQNYPLEAGVTNQRYLAVLQQALETIARFDPAYLVVSAGLDTYVEDPIGDFAVTTDGYPLIGEQIAALGLPTLVLQEGGYAVEALGTNVVALLQGLGAV